MDTECLNVPASEVCSFTRSSDNWGYPKLWAFPGYAHAPFSPNFNGLLFGWALRMFRPNLKSVASPALETTAIGVLGGGCEPPILGRGGRGWCGSKEHWRVPIGPP